MYQNTSVSISVSDALSVWVTFLSIHVAIENATQTHPIPAALKPVYGVGSLAKLKGGYGPAYRVVNAPQTQRNAYAVKETHTAKGEHEGILQTLRKTQRIRIKGYQAQVFFPASPLFFSSWLFVYSVHNSYVHALVFVAVLGWLLEFYVLATHQVMTIDVSRTWNSNNQSTTCGSESTLLQITMPV